MRRFVASLGVLIVAACAPATSAPPSGVPTLEPRNERAIRIYDGTSPRCGFRVVGDVAAANYRDLQARAFRLHANAVILNPQRPDGGGGMSGMAVAFTRADCQQ